VDSFCLRRSVTEGRLQSVSEKYYPYEQERNEFVCERIYYGMITRRRLVTSIFSVGLAVSAGCVGKVTAPEAVTVQNSSDTFEVAETNSWASGGSLEYKSTLVVDGRFTNVTNETREIPTARAEIATQSGTTNVDAQFSETNQWKQRSALSEATVDGGDSIDFRLFYTPESRTDVRSVTLVVNE